MLHKFSLCRFGLPPALGRTLGGFCHLARSFRDTADDSILTGDSPFRIALDQPSDIGGKGLAEPAFGCDLLTRFVNRVF